jgi:hypothetical protein
VRSRAGLLEPLHQPGSAVVDREGFVAILAERHYELVRQDTRPLPSGKAFWMGIFKHRLVEPLPSPLDLLHGALPLDFE